MVEKRIVTSIRGHHARSVAPGRGLPIGAARRPRARPGPRSLAFRFLLVRALASGSPPQVRRPSPSHPHRWFTNQVDHLPGGRGNAPGTSGCKAPL